MLEAPGSIERELGVRVAPQAPLVHDGGDEKGFLPGGRQKSGVRGQLDDAFEDDVFARAVASGVSCGRVPQTRDARLEQKRVFPQAPHEHARVPRRYGNAGSRAPSDARASIGM